MKHIIKVVKTDVQVLKYNSAGDEIIVKQLERANKFKNVI